MGADFHGHDRTIGPIMGPEDAPHTALAYGRENLETTGEHMGGHARSIRAPTRGVRWRAGFEPGARVGRCRTQRDEQVAVGSAIFKKMFFDMVRQRACRELRFVIACSFAIGSLLMDGCSGEREFIGEDGLFSFALTEDTPATFEGDDVSVFVVEERIEFPIEAPSDEQFAALSEVGDVSIPYDRLPWVVRGQYEIEIDWVLINLDEEPRSVTLTVNGFNEFHEYSPTVQVADEDVVVDFSQWERMIRLEPRERRFGTIREEELDEIAVDLATVVNGAPNPNQIVFFENQSALDERAQQFIPDVVPALTGVRLGMVAFGAGGVVLEATVRARDESGRIVSEEDRWELPQPELFEPAAAVAAAQAASMAQ